MSGGIERALAASLAPVKAESEEKEGGGQRLEMDELGHEFLGSIQFLLQLA